MRSPAPLLVLGVCSLGAAQAPPLNVLDLYSGATAASSRGSLGTAAGELLQRFHSLHFRGIGDEGSGARCRGVHLVVQDQDARTAETYQVVMRTGGQTGPTGVWFLSGALSLPGGGSGSVAYILNLRFATPVNLQSTNDMFVGVRLPAAQSWPSDGVSVHFCSTKAPVTDLAHTGAPNYAWQIDTASGTVSQPSQLHWRMGFLTLAPAFRAGNTHKLATVPNPAFGLGGMFPDVDVPRQDGISFRAEDGSRPAGRAFVFLSFQFNAPFVVYGVGGRIYLDAGLLHELTSFSLDANGHGQQDTFPQGSLPTYLYGPVPFQVLSVDAMQQTCAMSNGQAICF